MIRLPTIKSRRQREFEAKLTDTTDVEELVAALQSETVSARRRRIRIVIAFSAAVLVSDAAASLYPWRHGLEWNFLSWSLWVVVGVFMANRRQNAAARRAAEFDDLRVTGSMLDALFYLDTGINRIALAALERLLPRIQASDALLITERQRGLLRKAIAANDNRPGQPFVLGALQALEQIGTGADIPAVELLVRKPEPIHSAAIACLELLRQRASEEEIHGRLLRPAMPAAGDMNVLVRPAGNGEGTDTGLLVRPAGVESATAAVEVLVQRE